MSPPDFIGQPKPVHADFRPLLFAANNVWRHCIKNTVNREHSSLKHIGGFNQDLLSGISTRKTALFYNMESTKNRAFHTDRFILRWSSNKKPPDLFAQHRFP